VALALGAAYFIATGTRAGQDFLLKRLVQTAMAAPDPEPFDGLRVFMCGTSSPLPAPGRAQACVAVTAGEHTYIVDAGAGSPLTIGLARQSLKNLRGIFLTHFHSDHIAAIGDFNLLSWVAGRPQRLEIIGPEGVDRIVAGFNEVYALDRQYRVAHHGADLLPPELHVMQSRTIEPGIALQRDGLVVRAFTVDHSPVAPALGYRFDYLGRSVVISGDSVASAELQQAAQGADLLLHDAMSLPIVMALESGARSAGRARQAQVLRDIQDYHAAIASLPDLAEQAGVRQLALYHLVPPPGNFLFAKIFERDLPAGAIVTEDAMVFELPGNSEEIVVR
jgi:ribonuclease Z